MKDTEGGIGIEEKRENQKYVGIGKRNEVIVSWAKPLVRAMMVRCIKALRDTENKNNNKDKE